MTHLQIAQPEAINIHPSRKAASIKETANNLQSHLGDAPEVAVVLGSGWAAAAGQLARTQHLSYTKLPAFVAPQVSGHGSEVVLGIAGKQRVAMLCGRTHTYEHGDCAAMAGAIRSLQAWGVRVLVLTNSAGSLRSELAPGSLMLIADHINAPQRSPLVGEHDDTRFVCMSAAYDPTLRAHALSLAAQRQLALLEGTYLWAFGPQFETPAEVRLFRGWGADVVGMSTVPETIIARHCGLRVLGLSLVTNMAAGLSTEKLSHTATLKQAQASGAFASNFLTELISTIPGPNDSACKQC